MFNVANLASDIAFRQPPDLPFADHVHRLIAGNGSQRPIDGPEPQSDRDSSLEESVVLLEHIVLPVGEHPSGFPAFCARSVCRSRARGVRAALKIRRFKSIG